MQSLMINLIEEYLHKTMKERIVRDESGDPLPEDYYPDVICMLIQEKLQGPLASGLIGYVLALGYDIEELGVLIPRTVSCAALELLRPFAEVREDVAEIVRRCDRANAEYLGSQDVEQADGDNIHVLH